MVVFMELTGRCRVRETTRRVDFVTMHAVFG